MLNYDVVIVGACTAGTYFSTLLAKEGLIEEVPSFRKDEKTIDYEAVRAYRQPYLRKAFEDY